MAIRTVITRGFGNGTFNGTIPLVTTRGYAIAEPPVERVSTPERGVAFCDSRIVSFGGDRVVEYKSSTRVTKYDY